MYQQIEQAKKTLESVFIEVIEALKSNTGPIAERLLNEYSLRSYIAAAFGFITSIICSVILYKIVKTLNKEYDKDPCHDISAYGIISTFLFIAISISFILGISSSLDAVSPLYSLIKSIR